MRNSVYDTIRKKIQKANKGSLIFPAHFRGLADPAAISMALSRLTKEGIITRLGRGIYVIPKCDPLLGLVYPSLEEIAKAIADTYHVRIGPTGSYALNRLGLSTQVPTKVVPDRWHSHSSVFENEGNKSQLCMRIQAENKNRERHYQIQKSGSQETFAESPISSLVILALEELRQDAVTPDIHKKLKELLKHETEENLINDLQFAPAWIRKFGLTNRESSK